MQINVKAGLTFAAALRSILRSDPDVVMVGEIRDGETAKISIEAALTGHMVLSTLHTNDAPSALTRLNEMGVEPFLVGAAVTGVLAQRLARKLCSNCAEMYTPTRPGPDRGEALPGRRRRRWTGWPSTARSAARAATRPATRGGSASSSSSQMTEDLAAMAARRRRARTSRTPRWPSGMRTLWDDGMAKVAQGLTTVEELARVVVAVAPPYAGEASRYSVYSGLLPR